MTALLARVLDDINNRRVFLGPRNTVILTDDTEILPYEHGDYARTVRVLCDASWAMEERRVTRNGDRVLRLTTIGEMKRLQRAEAVTL